MKKYILLISLILVNSVHPIPFKDEWKGYKDTHVAMFSGKQMGVPIGIFPTMLLLLGGGYAGWKLAESEDLRTTGQTGPVIQDFVKETLAQVGYTPAEINSIKITDNRRLKGRKKAIVLTIDDKTLIEALKLKKVGNGYKILNQDSYDHMKKWYPKLPEKDLLLILASRGDVLTADSIALFKWDIIQQAIEIFSSSTLTDVTKAMINIASIAYFVSYLDAKKASYFSWHLVPAILPILSSFIADLYMLRNYIKQTDLAVMQKSIESDPDIIETHIKLLKAYDELDKHRSFVGNTILSLLAKLGGLKNYTVWFEKEYESQKSAFEDYQLSKAIVLK